VWICWMWGCGFVGMWGCENVEILGCANMRMSGCAVVGLYGCGYVILPNSDPPLHFYFARRKQKFCLCNLIETSCRLLK